MVEIAQVAGPAELGECPIWSEAEQVLYWIDIDGRTVRRFNPTTGADEQRTMAGRPGSMVLTTTPGRFLVATEHLLVWFDWATGITAPFAQLEQASTGNRLNDGRTDPAGRFVVGSMWEDSSARVASGLLHQVEADGSSTVVRREIGVTNGIAFDPERGRAYFADTHTATIVMWDYDVDSGTRRNERLFFDYSGHPGAPDGGCVDADGCYWSASVGGWSVIRITPDGELDRRIEVPVHRPSMPCFGGPDLSTLYLTSIRSRSDPDRDGFDQGALLAIDAGTQGVLDTPFATG